MNIAPEISILTQIGATAATVALLYGLQRLTEAGDGAERDRLERRRTARRLAARERIEARKRLKAEFLPLFAPTFLDDEDAYVHPEQAHGAGNSPLGQRAVGEPGGTGRFDATGESPLPWAPPAIKMHVEEILR